MTGIREAFAWLDAHVNVESVGVPAGVSRRGAHPTLARMEALEALLGSPQLEYPVIHVTGTNGKGSSVRIATALLEAVGLSTGAYTSPHLERVNERIVWAGAPIADDVLASLLGLVADIEEYLPDRPSYFEILTGAGLRWFADVVAEIAVVEVGLGGTWDATNVCDARVAVVTNVSIDHVEYLGPTRESIATEKAGIVKPTTEILVLGEADPVLRPIFTDRGARTVTRGIDFGVASNRVAHGGRAVSLQTPHRIYPETFLALHGAHQAENAAVALTAVEALLGTALDPSIVDSALATVRSPGRLEVVAHQPSIILDGAHNVAGARALSFALDEEFASASRTLVVGLLREKEPHEMLEALGASSAGRVVCCRPPIPRARDPRDVAAAARDLGVAADRILVVNDVAEAVAGARERSTPDEQIVVTGSLYVVGAARAALVPSGRESPD